MSVPDPLDAERSNFDRLRQYIRTVKVTQDSTKNPGQPIELELSVIDTFPNDTSRPVVLGFHGIPDWGGSFEPLILWLKDKGVRFVGPTLPGNDNLVSFFNIFCPT